MFLSLAETWRVCHSESPVKVKWIYPGGLCIDFLPPMFGCVNKSLSRSLDWIAFLSGFYSPRHFGKIRLPNYLLLRSKLAAVFHLQSSEVLTCNLSVMCRVFWHRLVYVLDTCVLWEPCRTSYHHRWGALLHWGEHWRECQANGSCWGEGMPSR